MFSIYIFTRFLRNILNFKASQYYQVCLQTSSFFGIMQKLVKNTGSIKKREALGNCSVPCKFIWL